MSFLTTQVEVGGGRGCTVERDAFNEDTQPWRARRPDEEGWLVDELG